MSKFYIITGGSFSNKGAQAMVFSAVQELKSNHPECTIWMLSRKEELGDIYTFNLLTWDDRIVKRLLLGRLKTIIKPSANYFVENKIKDIFQKADTVFDVSGFALSSQFGFRHSLDYLLRIALCKKYKTDLVLLPQSFGPFKYNKTKYQLILFPLMKLLLKYPRIIFSREKQGYNDLRRFTNKNLIKSPDLVLLTERPIREVIYNNPTKKQTSLPSKQNVAIIPNTMLLRWNKENEILALYKNIITFLTNKHYNICIIRHSKEDLGFCHNISELVDAKSKKEFFGDYDCIELSEIISNMDFVIASRYHSLIHAYKSGVPAIVIGWAEKYPEIMSQFNQKKYYFDIRKKVDISKLMSALKDIINNLSAEEDNMNKKLKYFKQKHYNLKNVIQL